jgi:heme A synthase
MHPRRHPQQQQLLLPLPPTIALQAAAGAATGSSGQQPRVVGSSVHLAGGWGLSWALLLQLSWQHQQQQQQQQTCPQPLQHLRLLQQLFLQAAGSSSSLHRSTLRLH